MSGKRQTCPNMSGCHAIVWIALMNLTDKKHIIIIIPLISLLIILILLILLIISLLLLLLLLLRQYP